MVLSVDSAFITAYPSLMSPLPSSIATVCGISQFSFVNVRMSPVDNVTFLSSSIADLRRMSTETLPSTDATI